ncbi:ABC transporter substrate-binding protein [Colwelliaceae bacterium 6471]
MQKSAFFVVMLFIISPVYASEIILGMSNALTGPTKNLGLQLKLGSELYFNKHNKSEYGKKNPIRIISYDDGYEPNKTVKNTKELLEKQSIFALFGYVGTPTSKAIIPMLEQQKSIYFAPYTGAEFLRTPHRNEFFNIRASYYNEAETQIKYFVDKLGLKNVALFIQADDFGLAASKGYIKALKERNITKVEQVRYKRNTIEIKDAVNKLIYENPEVIFCIGTYQPISELVHHLRGKNISSKIVTLSFAGAESLRTRLINEEEIYITSVIPDPEGSNLPIVKEYRTAMGNKKLSHESLEGYINAAVFSNIINNIQGNITKENFIKAAEATEIDVGGILLRFTKDNHQGLKNSYLNKITKNGLYPVDF